MEWKHIIHDSIFCCFHQNTVHVNRWEFGNWHQSHCPDIMTCFYLRDNRACKITLSLNQSLWEQSQLLKHPYYDLLANSSYSIPISILHLKHSVVKLHFVRIIKNLNAYANVCSAKHCTIS